MEEINETIYLWVNVIKKKLAPPYRVVNHKLAPSVGMSCCDMSLIYTLPMGRAIIYNLWITYLARSSHERQSDLETNIDVDFRHILVDENSLGGWK
jgi:hypothetical protein